LRAIELLTINVDKVTLQKQIVELTEKSKEEKYIIKGKLADKEKEIELLNQRDSMNSEAISAANNHF
jgi:site-specific recombinase XerD